MATKITTDMFIERANQIHDFKYSYKRTLYIRGRDKVLIICPKHGEFSQKASHHLEGFGCKQCANEKGGDRCRLDTEGFIKRAQDVHGDTYDYSKVVYKQSKDKVIITCSIHNDFSMTPNNHTGGKQGCPECGRLNTSRSRLIGEPTILYYVKFNTYEGPLYKIGVTLARRGVIGRFAGRQVPPFEILKETIYPNGLAAFQEEQRLHREFKEFQYKGPKVLQGGNTELFIKDVLNIDSPSL